MSDEDVIGDAVEWTWLFQRNCPSNFYPNETEIGQMKLAFLERLDPYEAAAAITEGYDPMEWCSELADGGKWKRDHRWD